MATNYLQDILAQPEALRATLASLAADDTAVRKAATLTENGFKRYVLTGMGSSLHALYPLCLRLSAALRPCWLMETSELLHYGRELLGIGALVVAVSQSGAGAEVVRLVESGAAVHPLIAVTNNPESPLAASAAVTLLTKAGDEASVSSKTYLAAIAALYRLGDLLLGDGDGWFSHLAAVCDLASVYLSGWKAHVDSLARELEGIEHLFLVGRGLSLTTARTGGLIMKESTRHPAEGMSCGAFRHGPFEMVSKRGIVVVFEGDVRTRDLNLALARDVAAAGGRSLLVGASSPIPACRISSADPVALPFLEFLPVQMISLALARLGGFEAGRFQHASKVTTVE